MTQDEVQKIIIRNEALESENEQLLEKLSSILCGQHCTSCRCNCHEVNKNVPEA